MIVQSCKKNDVNLKSPRIIGDQAAVHAILSKISKIARMEALERRLRSIYEALESKNTKSALKLTAAAAEKHPGGLAA